MRSTRTQGASQCLRSVLSTLRCVWQRGVTKPSNISLKRSNSKISYRFMPKLSVGTTPWNKRPPVSSTWACAASSCKAVFFPTVFHSGIFPTDMSIVIINCGVMLLYLALGKCKDSTGVTSICDLRQDLHVSNLNKEQPVQNPTGRHISEATCLQKVNLGFLRNEWLTETTVILESLKKQMVCNLIFRWKNFKITREKN